MPIRKERIQKPTWRRYTRGNIEEAERKTMTHIAFATTTELGKVLTDEKLLEAAFQAAGFNISHVAWNDDLVQWQIYDAVLIRTTWNYHLQPGKFVDRKEVFALT